ncbi:MAG: endonuclease MutS2 [Faecalibacterium sp.]|nr:endonuclease MutS2 [Ruminococcus sp.]MCM1392509.1 endonuclease MutS2 [Ruminococcus sp.]MCM1486094.1 endonuclease MutS2 [Faecalibacterium sp.]
MNRHYIALELDKVLSLLTKYTSCEDSREKAVSLAPESNLDLAQSLLNQTVDAHMLMARFGGPSFGGLRNVNNSLSRANAGGVLTMRELLDVAEVLRAIRALCEWRSKNSGVETRIDVFFDALTPNKYLEEKITSAIISEDEMSDNASPALYDIRRKIRAASSRVRDQLDKMVRSQHYQKILRESIVTMRNGRYVVPVRVEHRGEVKGLVHDTSSSGATVFIEPAGVVEANNEIKVLQSKERDEIERILTELSQEAGSFYEGIKSSYECAVELDVIFAKAKLAYEMKASAPILNDRGVINLRCARHPLIDPKKVVATDVNLGMDFDTLIITGPNTGGKTVSIKTIGLLSLMAMCGLMIPAGDRSELSVFEHVFADIGDEQSIEQSLSTFSSHMTNIINIVSRVNNSSLVLIDELGAGTDPVEGAALAMAILERIHEKGAKIAATTHYAELKAYALQNPGIENGSCEFDVASLRPTYKLLIGVPGRSNAFAISSRLGMETGIIERAKELVSDDNISFEKTVESLEESRQEYEAKRLEAEQIMAQAEKEKQQAQQYNDSIEQLREQELENARSQAARIIEQAKRSAYALTQELERLKKESEQSRDKAEMARRAKQLMKRSMGEFDDIINPVVELGDGEDYVLPRPLKIGDEVLLVDIGKNAQITALENKKGEVEVFAGIMKMRTPVSNIRLITDKQKQPQKKRTPAKHEHVFRPADSGKSECDLRGMNVEEAIIEIDRRIDYCMRMGLSELSIIHGKGTGALRKGVQEYLRKHRFVKSFRLGTFGEGENGVTIATLK